MASQLRASCVRGKCCVLFLLDTATFGGSDTWRSQLVTPDTFPRSSPGHRKARAVSGESRISLVQLQLYRLPLNLDKVSLKHVLSPRFCS